MDSDSDIEIVEAVNKKTTPRELLQIDKETENLAHEKACKDRDCKRCLYIRNVEK